MMRFSLLCLFILSVEGLNLKKSSFLKRGDNLKMKENRSETVLATEKFKLFQDSDGAWKSTCDVRGLALGGWFVPEKFINIAGYGTPDMPQAVVGKPDAEGTIYEGHMNVNDVCELSKKIGREELDDRMMRHLANFIKEDDFKYIASTGVNTLRIPVAYWNVVADPYKIYAPIDPKDSLMHLDNAMQWAQKHGLAVILDLHGSPGSQNGWEHSGCGGTAGLFKGGMAKKNQELSVKVVEKLAYRYKNHPALLGIEIINEPTGYEKKELQKLYKDSYDAIRKHDKNVWVIVYAHNAEKVQGLRQYNLTNFVLDKHEYACFGDGRTVTGRTLEKHVGFAKKWGIGLDQMTHLYPTILGEWSLCHGGGLSMKLKDWNKIQQDTWKENTIGAVFWTYKTLSENARWNYRVAQDYVDVMGDLPRCRNEPARGPPKLLKEEPEVDVEAELMAEAAEEKAELSKKEAGKALKDKKATDAIHKEIQDLSASLKQEQQAREKEEKDLSALKLQVQQREKEEKDLKAQVQQREKEEKDLKVQLQQREKEQKDLKAQVQQLKHDLEEQVKLTKTIQAAAAK